MNYSILLRNNPIVAIFAIFFVVGLNSLASGQGITPIDSYFPYSENAKYTRVSQVMGDQDYQGETKQLFLDHFQKYTLSRWTISSKTGDIPLFREEILRDLSRGKTGGTPHSDAVKLVFDFCYNVIANPKCANYPVAVKYNAMLLLGGLREKESDGSRSQGVPYTPALDLCLKSVSNAKLPEYLQIGAVKSLLSFVDTQLSLDQKKAVTSFFYKAIQEKVDTNSSAGAVWKKELAIAGMAKFADPGSKGEVIDLLCSIIGDNSSPLSTRIAATGALSSFNYSIISSKSSTPLRHALASMIADCLQEELERPTESLRYQGEAKRSRRTNNASDMYVDDMSMQEDYKDSIYLRQRVIAPLAVSIKAIRGDAPTKGLAGIGDFGSEEEKNKMKGLMSVIDKLVRDLKKEEIEIESVQEILKRNQAGFSKISKAK